MANRIFFVPSKGLGCVVVTNQSNAGELANSICDEVMTSQLPDWRRPEEDCGFPSGPLPANTAYLGRWQGVLVNDGARLPIRLHIESDQAATLAIGSNRAEAVTKMRAEGEAFTGLSSGETNSPDAIRTGAKTLQIKLLLLDDRLVGRVFALAGDPNLKSARLPYVVNLSRS